MACPGHSDGRRVEGDMSLCDGPARGAGAALSGTGSGWERSQMSASGDAAAGAQHSLTVDLGLRQGPSLETAILVPEPQGLLRSPGTGGDDAPPVLDLEIVIGASMRVFRERHRSVAAFAKSLSARLGRSGLSRQAVYDWEQCRSRVPTVVWIVAAELAGLTPNEALEAGWRRAPVRRQVNR